MKSFKVTLAALALSMVAAAPLAQAQGKKGGQSTEQYLERVEQAVGSLTDEQKTKIKDIVAKAQEEMRGVPKEERKGKVDARNDKIRAVLTPEQKQKFDAMPQGGRGGGKKKDN